MKLFKFEMYKLQVDDAIWGLTPFKKLLDRDKTKDKSRAFKEILFIYHFADIKSDYNSNITDIKDREEQIKRDIKLPKTWKIDPEMKVAINFYVEMSETPSERLYKAAIKAADDIAEYLGNTHALLYERDDRGRPVNDFSKITNGLAKIPKIMQDLKAAYKELLKEQETVSGKQKGSQTFNIFEKGLDFDSKE